MANEDTVLSGNNMNFKNITLKGNIALMVRISTKQRIYLLKKDNVD